MKALRIGLMVATVSLVAVTVARGETIGTRMEVTATVPANCRLTVNPLSFGAYDPLLANASQPADASAIMIVNCTRNTSASVSFDLGLNGSGAAERIMTGAGTDRLRYQIYRDAAHSQMWGQGGDAMRIVSKAASQPQQLTVFGRIPPQQEVEAGGYNDALTAAVDF